MHFSDFISMINLSRTGCVHVWLMTIINMQYYMYVVVS